MADHFARPLRLTRSEALALYLRGTELVATPGLPEAPALASALAKLRETLGPETLGDAEARIETVGGGSGARAPRRCCGEPRGARARSRSSTSRPRRGSGATRAIEPEEVFSSLGQLVRGGLGRRRGRGAALPRRSDPSAVAPTGDASSRADSRAPGATLYTPGRRRRPRPPAAAPGRPVDRRVLRHRRTRRSSRTGRWRSRCPPAELGWVARLLLRVGPDAEVIVPAGARRRGPRAGRTHARALPD